MITNLKQKLASMNVENNSSEKKPKLSLSCTCYENIYDKSHMIGDVPLSKAFDMNINSLAKICLCDVDEKLALSDIVFFDTETTGLGTGTSTTAFLIGVGYFEDNKFICKQFFMNDYYQESDMLHSLNDILSNHKAVVSYNGKAYDSHIINTRSILNRITRKLDNMIQLDLLHCARRLYKKRLPSCSMQSIEKHILNLNRVDDIAGALIPEIFLNYIKYGDDTMLSSVIKHNLLDVVNMCAIAYSLVDSYENPQNISNDADKYSQGIIFERLGFPHEAILCYNSLENYSPAVCRLGFIYKNSCDYDKSIVYFHRLNQMDKFGIVANIELAKIYEHKLRDYRSAMHQTLEALDRAISPLSTVDEKKIKDIQKRKKRLSLKLS